jgi:hypothetical protein
MYIKHFLLILIAFGSCISTSYAQNSSPDSLLYSSAANKIIDYFNEAIADQSEIYNGAEYQSPLPAYKGSVYFQDKNYCTPGIISYNGTRYKNIPVLYDVFNDIMVAAARNNSSNYILRSEKVSDVYLSDHHFIYISAQNTGNLTPGFYDQLYSGKTQVLIKRIKTIKNNITSQGVEVVYKDYSDIYIKKGNTSYQVNSKGSVLDIFKDKKKELNQFLGNNKIRYNDNKEASVVKLAYYYDQITH